MEGIGLDIDVAQFVVAEYHKSLANFAKEQEKVLENLLRTNSKCEYLRRHGLQEQTDVDAFKELLPVIEYDAIEQDVKRIAEGDTSPILCCESVTRLHLSSGTTSGNPKMFPITQFRGLAMKEYTRLLDAFTSLSPVHEAAKAGLSMSFVTATKESTTPGGLAIAPGTTFYLTSPGFKQMARSRFVSPIEVILCEDYRQSTYCHFLCGLLQSSQVTRLVALFAPQVASAFSVLKELWREMTRDIETGELSSLVTDPCARASVTKLLAAPNPHLAASVRGECGRDSWEGIVTRLWPHARCIQCVATGSMAQYVDYINFLTSAQLPILSYVYTGTEGLYGFNPCFLTPPSQTSYVLFHNHSIYFEFMRVNREQSLPRDPVKLKQEASAAPSVEDCSEEQPVGLAGVEEGRQYQLIVTNGEGLWRYKVGDVLQCVGFYHRAPKFMFVGREKVVLSVHSDKTEEQELSEAVNIAAKQHLPANARLYDFTSCVSLDSVPGHYVLFWEIHSISGDDGEHPPIHAGDGTLAEACFTMEAALSVVYRHQRRIGVIAPLELRIVRPRTFAQLAKGALEKGSSPSQYKTPRAIRAGCAALDILNAAVAGTSRSPRVPSFSSLTQ